VLSSFVQARFRAKRCDFALKHLNATCDPRRAKAPPAPRKRGLCELEAERCVLSVCARQPVAERVDALVLARTRSLEPRADFVQIALVARCIGGAALPRAAVATRSPSRCRQPGAR
jgi:hypothetical protein